MAIVFKLSALQYPRLTFFPIATAVPRFALAAHLESFLKIPQ